MANGADRPLSFSHESPALDSSADRSASDGHLPDFRKPPVIEVAASLQFEPIEGLDALRFGLLWGMYRDRYQRGETHPPLGDAKEVFGPMVAAPRLSFSLEAAEPALRYWFLNERGTRMLQVQRSRFVLNWRKMDTEEAYPRYPEIRQTLREEYDRFSSFLESESLPHPSLNQVELTYVNHIPVSPFGGGRREDLRNIVRLWLGEPPDIHLPPAEDVSFKVRYVMPSPDVPRGRLYISLDTRVRARDNVPILVLQLIARGAPEGPGFADAMTFMDMGRRWIVQAFAAITTPEMHQAWERVQ